MAQQSEKQSHDDRVIRVGTAGWSYPDWSGLLYPKKRSRNFHELGYLAEFIDTVEINTSFYAPLQPEHCRQWLAQVAANPSFRFTAKLWQGFTHQTGATVEDERLVRAGFDVLRGAYKLGALLLQFPFSFHHDAENVVYLKALLDRFGDYPLVVEVRHASWNEHSFYDLLHHRGVGFCNIDQPLIGRSLKPTERSTASIGYVRLHGRRYDTWFSDDPDLARHERYNYLYSESELQPWAEKISHIAKHSENTFVVANNHYEAKGVVNALQLINLLTGQKVKVPEQLREHYPELNQIASTPPEAPTLFPIGV